MVKLLKKEGWIPMREYILSIVCVSIVGSLISMLAPDGEGGGLGRHTRLVFGLCFIIVCLSPITSVIEYINDFSAEQILENIGGSELENEQYNEIFNNAYASAETENLKNGIKKILYDKFEVDYSECTVGVTLKQSELNLDGKRELDKIFITLYGSAFWSDTGAIEEYLHSLFKCEIVTAVGE